jgi:hypothetical protein
MRNTILIHPTIRLLHKLLSKRPFHWTFGQRTIETNQFELFSCLVVTVVLGCLFGTPLPPFVILFSSDIYHYHYLALKRIGTYQLP